MEIFEPVELIELYEPAVKKPYYKYSPKHCDICNINVSYYRWHNHQRSLRHMNNGVFPAKPNYLHCEFCKKDILRKNWDIHSRRFSHIDLANKGNENNSIPL